MKDSANDSGPIHPVRTLLALALEWYANAQLFVIVAQQDVDVRLPDGLEGFVCLSIEPANPLNVQGMECRTDGFAVRLHFGGTWFDVFVPWRAIVNVQTPTFAVSFKTAIKARAGAKLEGMEQPDPDPQDDNEPPKLRIVK